MSKFRLTIHHDDGPTDDPFSHDTLFRMHSFKRGDWHESDAPDLDYFDNLDGYWLSHYEHGLRRFHIQGTASYPDMRWDGVHTAGFLEVDAGEDASTESKEWWNGMTDNERLKLATGMIEAYTNWLNGEVYGYVLESVEVGTCDMGFTHEVDHDESVYDSCWGIIGSDGLELEVQMTTDHHGATADNTTVVDKAYGATDYMDLFKKGEVNA